MLSALVLIRHLSNKNCTSKLFRASKLARMLPRSPRATLLAP